VTIHLEWSEALGKRVRSGDWGDQAISTITKIQQALEDAGDEFGPAAGRREQAAQLVDYFMEEAKGLYVAYGRNWTPGFLGWLRSQGVPDDETEAELGRLRALLAYPDGTPFEPAGRWRDLSERAGRLAGGIRSYDLSVMAARDELEGLRTDWRQLHDRYADLMAGIVGFIARRFGEAAVETCWRAVLEPYVDDRYAVFDVRRQPYEDSLERNLYYSVEGMRTHLGGPGRLGDLEIEELDDRWQLRFDPCGTGGRMLRGDVEDGTGSRMLEPYEFGSTQGPHPWSWNEVGVCYYCTHCNLLLSTLPAERWGHPVRTIEPPLWRGPDDPTTRRKCQWTIWKSLDAIPEQEYERIGRTKPRLPVIQPDGSRAARAGVLGSPGLDDPAGPEE
jgi:hypothetical protein